ncbi:hypothetical protein PanWU01x14_291160 [Parasponia andersonii]|uniref:Uncharacterized protein n=1 Tax=Parasponia andersonii TaxID=3476 RepID=A0A2P5AXF6_PARAD|nr:hypothetical protein PanWU01x14_291160 [Parasponia andersonii]
MFSVASSVKSLFHYLSSFILSLKKTAQQVHRESSINRGFWVVLELFHLVARAQATQAHDARILVLIIIFEPLCDSAKRGQEQAIKEKKKKKKKKREIVLEVGMEGFHILEIGFQIGRKRIMGYVSESEGPREETSAYCDYKSCFI